ncbi:uncharacterized protein A1O9_11493 [Exophiala aquamarina CBS 119918]|uniref:Alpha/beta hydrolase fold-3 domain-containing protein n=1 Tax=Exophiala aquamarina CBS 119918 TaxID=1182545 RepID=A0A072NZ12_9EURO|nr:uncharacterized protein A1O9_11493 [Exophiala aquamarina CBS 119918]KEF52253.1 hypothetical protein A1O9_11493 [Exophiala aquamarina CBS 119918]
MAKEIEGYEGYVNKVIPFKTIGDLELSVDVLYPIKKPSFPSPVLVHYHGGFLVFGDRYMFFPEWLAQACVNRGWVFVTPDYRLIPETTAHKSLEDAVDVYQWVLKSLPSLIDIELGPAILAGSSAGGFLALSTSVLVENKPAATFCVYGMLDMINKHYLTKGSNIFGLPVFDTTQIREELKTIRDQPVLTSYAYPENSAQDPRLKIISTLHIDALFPDYMTGVLGLSEKVAKEGPEAISADQRKLYPLTFGRLNDLPPVLLVHGRNDSAVPAALSDVAVEKLQAAGVSVHAEFPDVAQHGYDRAAGRKLESESTEELRGQGFESLRKSLKVLDKIVAEASTIH